MASDYDYGSMFLYPLYGTPPVTSEDYRAQAVEMLREASMHCDSSRASLYMAAAQVHATLALTAPEAAGAPAPEIGGGA
jgi:NADPH-dependent ferric siderophore reductase